MKKESVEQRAVKIAARIMQADGLCRYDTPMKCHRVYVCESTCEKCIRSWLLSKARAELKKRGGEKVRSLIKRPGEGWTVTEIQNELEPLQRRWAATWRLSRYGRMPASCATRRGRIKGMPYNTTICGVSFVGPILIVGTAGEDFSDLTEQQEAALRAMGAVR